MVKSGVIVLVALAILLTSCATVDQVSLESNKDIDFNQTIERLFVVIETENLQVNIQKKIMEPMHYGGSDEIVPGRQVEITKIEQADLGNYLKDSIEQKFSQVGIETKAVVLTGLELDENSIVKEQDAFGSNTNMSLKRTGEQVDVKNSGYMGQYGWVNTTYSITTRFFDISITDRILEKRIWRSRVTIVGDINPATTDEIIHDLLVAMNTDGIITKKAAELPSVDKNKTISTGGWIILGILAAVLGGLAGWYGY